MLRRGPRHRRHSRDVDAAPRCTRTVLCGAVNWCTQLPPRAARAQPPRSPSARVHQTQRTARAGICRGADDAPRLPRGLRTDPSCCRSYRANGRMRRGSTLRLPHRRTGQRTAAFEPARPCIERSPRPRRCGGAHPARRRRHAARGADNAQQRSADGVLRGVLLAGGGAAVDGAGGDQDVAAGTARAVPWRLGDPPQPVQLLFACRKDEAIAAGGTAQVLVGIFMLSHGRRVYQTEFRRLRERSQPRVP